MAVPNRRSYELSASMLATVIVLLVAGSVCVAPVATSIGRSQSPADLLLAFLVLPLVIAVHMHHVREALAGRWRKRRRWTLAGQALVAYLPLVQFEEAWLGVPGLLAGSLLLLMPSPYSWFVVTALAAAQVPVAQAVGTSVSAGVYAALSVALTGLVTYGVVRLAASAAVSRAESQELAAAAARRERAGFLDEMHDLMGRFVTTVALKSELASRLVDAEPERAQREMNEIVDAADEALARVRAVARGHGDLSLATESAAVRKLLDTAGVECRMSVSVTELPREVESVLARTLREGVTNVLRHSAAATCSLEVTDMGDRIKLVVVNDGVPRGSLGSQRGSGIRGLQQRAANVEGWLVGERMSAGRFRLVAELPRKAGEETAEL